MMKLSTEKLHSLQKAYGALEDSTTVGLATTNCEIKTHVPYMMYIPVAMKVLIVIHGTLREVPDTSAGMASFGDAKGSTASNSVIHVKHVHGAFSTTDGADVQEKGRNGKKPQHPSLGMGKTKADNAQIN
ncbi:hypothetical protein Bca4012_084776 [Brassica carinata]|uniref:Uncharacterized protein n=1 Tax=Brassica carinata TaxID=52824 RepID=A0A8X7WIV0_BRACI|nr:hypothetical protein Bca52824_001155 [Brassica carinata]